MNKYLNRSTEILHVNEYAVILVTTLKVKTIIALNLQSINNKFEVVFSLALTDTHVYGFNQNYFVFTKIGGAPLLSVIDFSKLKASKNNDFNEKVHTNL